MDRYSIATLTLDGLPVWFTTGGGEVRGHLKTTRKGRRIYRVVLDRVNTVDLPDHATPSLWRPISADAWPEPLPAPAVVMVAPARPVPILSEPEAFVESGEGWPYPNVRLGSAGEPPETERELEARILRALRTQDTMPQVIREKTTAWPGALIVRATAVREALRASRNGRLSYLTDADHDDIYIDRSDLEARPARWSPTPRDVSDYAGNILRHAARWSRVQRRIAHRRSLNPPHSWRQIADLESTDTTRIRQLYDSAMRLAWETARHETAHDTRRSA